MRLELNYFLTCNIWDNLYAIIFKPGMTVDECMAYILILDYLELDRDFEKVCNASPACFTFRLGGQ